MLKIRIIAAFISLVLTAITLYLMPKIYFAYIHWAGGFSVRQQYWFNISQAVVGVLIALLGLWLWWKKKAHNKKSCILK